MQTKQSCHVNHQDCTVSKNTYTRNFINEKWTYHENLKFSTSKNNRKVKQKVHIDKQRNLEIVNKMTLSNVDSTKDQFELRLMS